MQLTGRTLRLHLLAYSTLTLVLTLGLVVAVAWVPLNRRISEGANQTLSHDTMMRARVVDESLRRASDLAWQISSRTAARIATADYARGTMDLATVREQLTPRLRDAVEFSAEIRGLVRFDSKGLALMRIGPALLDSMGHATADYPLLVDPPVRYASRGQQGVSRIVYLGNEPHVLIYTPVFAPDQRIVAHDILLYRVDAIVATMSAPMAVGHQTHVHLLGRDTSNQVEELLDEVHDGGQSTTDRLATTLALKQYLPLLDRGTHVAPSSDNERLLCATALGVAPWWLTVEVPRSALMRDTHAMMGWILLAVFGLGLLGLGGSMLLMRPLRDKILVAQGDLLGQVKEMAAVRDQLEVQSAMLKERNEDLRHFAWASAHDLKSPLVSIGGHAQILLDRLGPDLPEGRRQSLEFILAGSKRMFQHVNDMLDYSRAAEMEAQFSVIAFERITQELLSALDGRIRQSGAHIRLRATAEIYSDRRLLRMILQNLVDNALCYHQPDQAPEIELSAEIVPGSVVIRVKDNGLGIAPNHQPQIFDSYYRLHDDAKIPGTGLGLAICLRAVKRLGGSIELESEPGCGSTFTVRLPQPEDDDATDGQIGV